MAHVLLWGIGALFIGVSPWVTHSDSPLVGRLVGLGLAIIGALCWRFA